MKLSRRSLVLALASAGALPLIGGTALAQGPTRFSSVAADVRRLEELGLGGPYAELVRSAVTEEARRVFADRLGGPGPRLVIRITAVSLRPYVGNGAGGSRSRGGGGDTDYIEGEALVVGPRGEVLARYPQLFAAPSSSAGVNWQDPLSEQKRTVVLAQYFTQWLRRTIG